MEEIKPFVNSTSPKRDCQGFFEGGRNGPKWSTP